MYRSHATCDVHATTSVADSCLLFPAAGFASIAANDNNEDERGDATAHEVVAILLRDGFKLLAG